MLGAEVIAIEDTDSVGWVESATTIGEVNFNSVPSFVDNILADLGDRQMSLLHIQVHGSPTHISFGPTQITNATFAAHLGTFARLSSKFAPHSWVDLRACNIGQNIELLQKFRRLWNVGIVAGRGSQNNVMDFNLGSYQIVSPNGNESTQFFAPSWVEYSAPRRAARAITSRF
jgi:hypothetical protein